MDSSYEQCRAREQEAASNCDRAEDSLKEVRWLALVDEINCVRVVLILYKVPLDVVGHVDRLLVLEHVLNEEVVQRFVRQVDAELAERILLKILEPENVEDADGVCVTILA